MDPDPGDVYSGGGGVSTYVPQAARDQYEAGYFPDAEDEPEDPDNVDTSPMCPCGTCPDTGPFPCVRRD